MADVNVNFELEPDVTFLADLTVETSTPTVHGELSGRDYPNQHPISAITGLEQELSDLSSETQEGKTAYETIQTYGNIVTHNVNEFATASQGELSLTALQPNDNISELTNNVGYITGITSSNVTSALGYTPYDSSNPAGYTSNVGTVTSVNNTQPVNGNVTLSIPTATSDLNNDSGFITSSALTGYATETYVNNGLATKQDTLVSGTNIKTINNQSLLGSGNITIGGGGGAVDSVNGYTGTVVLKTSDLANDSGYITNSAIANMQTTTNLVTSVSSSSTNSEYPSAKLFYDTCGDIETLINAL